MKLYKIDEIELSTQETLETTEIPRETEKRILCVKLFRDSNLRFFCFTRADKTNQKLFKWAVNGLRDGGLLSGNIKIYNDLFVTDDESREMLNSAAYVTQQFCKIHENCVIYRYYRDNDKLLSEEHQSFYQPTPQESLIFKKDVPVILR